MRTIFIWLELGPSGGCSKRDNELSDSDAGDFKTDISKRTTLLPEIIS